MKEHLKPGGVQRLITDAVFRQPGPFTVRDIADELGQSRQYPHNVIVCMGCVFQSGVESRHTKPAKLYIVDADPTARCAACTLYDRKGACQYGRGLGEDGREETGNATAGQVRMQLTQEEWQVYLRMSEEGHTGHLTNRRGIAIKPIATIQDDGTVI